MGTGEKEKSVARAAAGICDIGHGPSSKELKAKLARGEALTEEEAGLVAFRAARDRIVEKERAELLGELEGTASVGVHNDEE